MSSYMVEYDTIRRIVSWLRFELAAEDTRPYVLHYAKEHGIAVDGENWEQHLASDMYTLNYEATIGQRLDEKTVGGMGGIFFVSQPLPNTRYQALKTLDYYLYQCNTEDIVARPLYQFFQGIYYRLAMEIIRGLPEYKKAVWE